MSICLLFIILTYTHTEVSTGVVKTKYSCPVYKTLERRGVLSTTGLSTNFIVALELQMSGGHDESFWIRRGCAMIAALD